MRTRIVWAGRCGFNSRRRDVRVFDRHVNDRNLYPLRERAAAHPSCCARRPTRLIHSLGLSGSVRFQPTIPAGRSQATGGEAEPRIPPGSVIKRNGGLQAGYKATNGNVAAAGSLSHSWNLQPDGRRKRLGELGTTRDSLSGASRSSQ